MLPINTMQPVVRDRIPPTLEVNSQVSPFVNYGTSLFTHGLIALDEGKDISSDIQAKLTSLPNTFVENGTVDVTFYVYDSGANYVERSVSLDIVGSSKHPVPVLYDFSVLNEIPEEFTKTNGEWQLTSLGLQALGEMPSSPRWNIELQADADSDIQMEFVPIEEGQVNGLIIRSKDLGNMFYVFYRDNAISVTQRLDGVTTTHETHFVDSYTVDSVISLGVSCEGNLLSVYDGSEKVIEYENDDFRYASGFGVISTSDQAFYQKIMVGQAGALTFGEYEMANQPPTASAGPNQSVAAGVKVQLNGLNSTPGVSFNWYQVSGSPVNLRNSNTATPSFTSPAVSEAGAVVIGLTVELDGLVSTESTVTINYAAFSGPTKNPNSLSSNINKKLIR